MKNVPVRRQAFKFENHEVVVHLSEAYMWQMKRTKVLFGTELRKKIWWLAIGQTGRNRRNWYGTRP
jgi:hypothetical protein